MTAATAPMDAGIGDLLDLVHHAVVDDAWGQPGFDAFFMPFAPVIDAACDVGGIEGMWRDTARDLALDALRDLLLPVAATAFAPSVPRPRGSLDAWAAHAHGTPSRERYLTFLADGGVERCWRERPVFAEMGACVAWNTVIGVAEATGLRSELVGGPVTGLTRLASDRHDGRVVLGVTGPDGRAAWRPRDSSAAVAVQQWLAELDIPGVRALAVEAGDGSALVEWADDDGDPVAHGHGMGAWWTLLHAVGATDMHLENLVVTRDGVAAVDLEVLAADLAMPLAKQSSWPDACDVEAASTLLLPTWCWEADGGLVDLSPTAGSMRRRSRVPVPTVFAPGTDAMRLVMATGHIDAGRGAPHWSAADLAVSFDAGVRTMRDVLADEPSRTRLRAALIGATTRVIERDTIVYSELLWRLMRDTSVRERSDAVAALGVLADLPRRSGAMPDQALVDAESAALLAGDVPFFTASLSEQQLALEPPSRALASTASALLRVPAPRRVPVLRAGAAAAVDALRAHAVPFDDGSLGWLGTRWSGPMQRHLTTPLPWGLADGHLGVVVGLTVALRAGLGGEGAADLAHAAVARLRALDVDAVEELSLAYGLAGIALGLDAVSADWPTLRPQAAAARQRLAAAAADWSSPLWDFDDGAAGVAWALSRFGCDVPASLTAVIPARPGMAGLAHGDAGTSLATGTVPTRAADDLRPCWGAPGVALSALALGMDDHPSVADARSMLARPAADEPGSLCCGTAGRLAAGIRLGVDTADRVAVLARQVERVRGSSAVPADAWTPSLRFGTAGALVGLAVATDPDVAHDPVLSDFRPRSEGRR